MIGKLADWLGIPDPRTIAAILLVWLGSLAMLWAYMQGVADGDIEAAKAEVATQCAEQRVKAEREAREALEAAVVEARAKWTEAQSRLDAAAAADRAKIETELEQHRARAANLFRQLQAHIDAKPLDPVCRFDAERVRLFNEARANPRSGTP